MIYFSVMPRILRTHTIISITVLAGIAGLSIWWRINTGPFISSVREHIETELENMTGREISIGTAHISFPGSLVLGNLTAAPAEDTDHAMLIRTVTISPEILPLLTRLQVVWKIRAKGLSYDEISADLAFRSISRRCKKWEDAIDPGFVDNIVFMDGAFTLDGHSVTGIKGTLDLDDTYISRGNLLFKWRDTRVSCIFAEIPGSKGSYRGILRSPDLILDGILYPETDVLEIKKFSGVISSLGVDLEGLVLGLNSDNRTYELSGKIEGDISDLLSALPDDLKPPDTIPIRGHFLSRFDIFFPEQDFTDISLGADISSERISFGIMPADDIYGKISVSGGVLDIYDMSFSFMDGRTSVYLSADTRDTGLPLNLNIDTRGTDINKLINTARRGEKYIAGPLDLTASFSGPGRDLAILTGSISSTGALPGDKGLLSTMYLNVSFYLGWLRHGNLWFRDISSEFVLDNSRFKVASLDFNACGGSFRGKAEIDLSGDGSPLIFETSVRGMIPESLYPEEDGSNIRMRGPVDLDLAFRGPGEDIYRAFMSSGKRGARTAFLPAVSAVSDYVNILREENRTEEIEFEATVDIAGVGFPEADLDDISAIFSLRKGRFSVPSLSFSFSGGSFLGSGHALLRETLCPFSIRAEIRDMRADALLNKILALTPPAGGNLDADISIAAYGKDLPHILRDPRSYMADLIGQKRINDIELASSIRLGNIVIGGIPVENLSLKASLFEGSLDIPSLELETFGGAVSARADCDLTAGNFPFSLDCSVRGMLPEDIHKAFPGMENISRGAIDADISLNGPALKIWDTIKDHREGTGTTSLLEKLRSREILKDVCLYSFVKMDTLRLPGPELDEFYAVFSANRGVLNISSIGFRSFGGNFEGRGEVDLSDPVYPFQLTSRIHGMSPGLILADLFDIDNSVDGVMDLDFYFKGTGMYLSNANARFRAFDWDAAPSFRDKARSFLLILSDTPDLTSQKLDGNLSLNFQNTVHPAIIDPAVRFSFDKGRFSIPSSSFSPCKGAGSIKLDIDLTHEAFPFSIDMDIKNADLAEVLRSSGDLSNPAYGDIDMNLGMSGKLDDTASFRGRGQIAVSDANLGPVPILAPLLGGLYETLNKIFPAFKRTDITSASATFNIKDGKIRTNDLIFEGEDLCIVSEGYMDFDGNLNFSFTNELIAPETGEEEHWSTSIRNFIASFGRSVSRARLKGTLREQKWDFDYLTPISGNIGRNLRSFFQGISR